MFLEKIRLHKKQYMLLIGFILFMGILCFVLYDPLMKLLENREVLKTNLDAYGVWGELLYSLIMALQVIFVFLPGEIVEVTAGFLFGPWMGMLSCLLGSALGTSFIYVFVERWGISFIQTFIPKEKGKRFSFLQNKEKLHKIVFLLFFIPGTPKDILTYFIPLTDMKLLPFLLLTTIARIPSVVTSTVAGNAIGEENYVFSILIFAVTGVFSLIGMYAYKWYFEKRKGKSFGNLSN